MPFSVTSIQHRAACNVGPDADFYDENGNINSRLLYFRMFNSIGHVQMFYNTADQPESIQERLISEFGANNIELIFSLTINKNKASADFPEESGFSQERIWMVEKNILLHLLDDNFAFIFAAETPTATLSKLKELVEGNADERSKKKLHKFSMVTHQYGVFELEYFDIKKYEIDINKQYNEGFAKADARIREFLEQKYKSGIVLLHGVYGSGKTTYIRHLINETDKNFIYIPISMVSSLNDPDFLPFITQYRDSVLIIEDCEHLIQARKQGSSSSALVNLLNMGDGLLGDALQLKIITTFNSDLKDIDPALLRKGRLVVRYFFDKLEKSKAVALQKELGRKTVLDEAMTLADIYNNDDNDLTGNGERTSIGFKR